MIIIALFFNVIDAQIKLQREPYETCVLHSHCEKGQVSREIPPLGGSHGHPQVSLDTTIVFFST